MKKIAITFIRFYQAVSFTGRPRCRYTPTCSNYALQSFNNYGFSKGSWLSMKRIFRCRPFGPYGYDPVPEKF